MNKSYAQYVAEMQKIADVSYAIAVLQWDKEVQMPPKGAKFRSQQISTLSGIKHELATSDAFGELLNQLNEQKEELSPIEARNVELSRDNFLKNKKYSTDFVKLRSKTVSEAYHAWMAARKANDYNLFKEALGKLVDLSRKETELLGYEEHPYDALIDHYEKGTTVKVLDTLFKDVKAQLVAFVRELEKGSSVQNDFLKKHFSKDKQWDFGMKVLKEIGYDFEGGRQDISTHPFTINFSPQDVRVTTRIDENDFGNMLWSTIHEAGHALYEQGLKSEQYGLPCGKYNSLGMHESQSRLWENNVGRGLVFLEISL